MKNHKKTNVLFGVLILTLLQLSPVFALSNDGEIKQAVKESITKNEQLKGAEIVVGVEQRLVVLTGHVRLYEQKLVAGRIAWSTPDVFEIDNEIKVIPKKPLTDAEIISKVKQILKKYPMFQNMNPKINVEKGIVSIEGIFSKISAPMFLRHKVAEIEGVIDIKIIPQLLDKINKKLMSSL